MGGGRDGFPHISAQVNGNRNVVCLNRNDAERNLNLNDWNGDWNDLKPQQSPKLAPTFSWLC
jgi:hypothetical protein